MALTEPLNFNTSKVRLEESRVVSATLAVPNFNTSKVRLEVFITRIDFPSMSQFQYLKGAIGSNPNVSGEYIRHEFQYLKGAIGSSVPGGSPPSPSKFQYLKGAIGSASRSAPIHRVAPISIPQRCDWKRPMSQTTSPAKHEFQYLKGAIGRAVQRARSPALVPFQYLKGAIGSFLWALVRRLREPISIPQRCDWKSAPRAVSGRPARISIPQRCDWKHEVDLRAAVAALFQYLKGAIGRLGKLSDIAFEGAFQYLKGAIGRAVFEQPLDGFLLFQYLKGAIGRNQQIKCNWKCREFQYLKGAIGRVAAHVRDDHIS